MTDIPFTDLMRKLLEIEDENDEIYQNDEEEEADEFSDLLNDDGQKNEEEEEFDDNKIFGIIKSITFKIIDKCKKRICSSASISSFNAWKYSQKYLSFNIPLLFYILIVN